MAREVERITLRHVRNEAVLHQTLGEPYPPCRGKKHRSEGVLPVWNVQFTYDGRVGQSFYWCDVCLPNQYRTVADSMIRGKEHERVIEGEAREKIVTGLSRPRTGSASRIPWNRVII